MIIVGAGLAGLIAANVLREEVESVYEKQSSLPNNHHALLRFRSSIVGDACGVPFKQVTVYKAVQNALNPVADAARYSIKVLGRVDMRSILRLEQSGVRYIAPPDLVERLAKNVRHKIGFDLDLNDAWEQEFGKGLNHQPIISTIPMPYLMDELAWEGPRPDFVSVGGTVLRAELPETVNMYATVYVPGSDLMAYRVSVTGRTLIIEASDAYLFDEENPPEELIRKELHYALHMLGLEVFYPDALASAEVKRQKYAKIAPIPEGVRKDFIRWATEQHNVYSLGRFATWRPGLLLDDIVEDVRHIQRMVGGDGSLSYKWRKAE